MECGEKVVVLVKSSLVGSDVRLPRRSELDVKGAASLTELDGIRLVARVGNYLPPRFGSEDGGNNGDGFGARFVAVVMVPSLNFLSRVSSRLSRE